MIAQNTTPYNLSLYGCSDDIEGYIALAISILASVGPDEAFKRLNDEWKPQKRKWTKEYLMEIHQMREKGMGWCKIGEKVGRSPTYMQKKYQKLCSVYSIAPI